MSHEELQSGQNQSLDLSVELGLPEQLEPNYFREFDLNTGKAFCDLAKRYDTATESVFGNNEPLLQGIVRSHPESATITFDGASSCLWHDHNHVTRSSGIDCESLAEASRTSLSAEIQSLLLPWERWGEDLEYAEPTKRDGFAQAIDLKFPILDLTPTLYEFRLLLLLPSRGDYDSPLQGFLIISRLYLHSCFKALRHSRGNPGFWGSMMIDGRSVEITKNLETFLRYARHPSHAQMFYIRELCINRQDEAEREALLTGQFHALVEDCSCGVIDMSKAMYRLLERGLIPEPPRLSEKRWFDVSYENKDSPWHIPLILKYYTSHSGSKWKDISEAEISTFDDYEYVPIDLAAREIKLLGIHPAPRPEDPITVEVSHVPMSMNVNYHALSYVWGSPEITRYLKSWPGKIGVTENLYAAIHAFREGILHKDGGPVYLWVDAVCINQTDADEKNWSIARMHDIYEAAATVHTSIAPTHMLSPAVRGILEDIATDKIDCASPEPLGELAGSDAWAQLYNVLRLPYFGRRWIVQELASASAPHVMMAEGNPRALRTISIAAAIMNDSFPELFKLWQGQNHSILQQCKELSRCVGLQDKAELFIILSDIRHIFRRILKVDHIRHLHVHSQPPSFLFLAVLTQSARCADPRDVLYSLWNICREKSIGALPLDYDSSVEVCYAAFTRFFASQTNSLDIICISQSEIRRDQNDNTDSLDWSSALSLPSWCPDYRYGGDISSLIRYEYVTFGIRSYPNMDFAPFHADTIGPEARPTARFRFMDGSLILQGVILDTVDYISETAFTILPWNIAGHDFEQLDLGHYQYFQSKISKGSGAFTDRKPSKDEIFSDMLSMLAGETGTVKAKIGKSGPKKGQSRCTWEDNSPYKDMAYLFERATTFTKGRRLISTEDGFMGLVPTHAKKGYKIAILLGCSVPVLLERVDVTEDEDVVALSDTDSADSPSKAEWRFRGDCFVQHWMKGEMMKCYGDTTEKAWETLGGSAFELRIR